MGRLQDLVAVITGAGSGIGRASAQHFAREGARVVVADMRADAAAETTELIRGEGGAAECVQADVSDRAQVDAMIDARHAVASTELTCCSTTPACR